MAEISNISPHIVARRIVNRVRGKTEKIEIEDSSPIAMFDSGVGGLTVFEKVSKLLPDESIVYLADTARVPYGGRSPSEIIKINKEIIGYFLALGIKMIVMACGTSSSIAYPILKDKYKVPIVGLIEGGAKTAAAATKNKKIGIVATAGTINSGSYERALKELDKGIEVSGVACPLLVPLIEGGFISSDETVRVLKEYLKPLIQKKVDTLILGCTHYPHLSAQIRSIMGQNVKLVDPADEAANTVKEVLSKAKMLNPGKEAPSYRFLVTANANSFKELGSRLLKKPIPSVEEIDLSR